MLLLTLSLFFFPALANAQAQAPEPDLKAAILANMLLFVDWPNNAALNTDQLTLCYLENSPVAVALVRLDGKIIKGTYLKVVQTSIEASAGCHLLYVSPGHASTLARLHASAPPGVALLAGDSPEYFRQGVMLNLELVAGRVVFDIDLRAAQKSGIQISSKALRLARLVVESP